MNRDDVWRAIDDERSSLADLLDDLSGPEWETASLCAGWRVREVAAHLTLAHTGVRSAAVAMLRARGSFDRMIHDTAVRQAALPVEQYAIRLRGMVGSRRKAPGVTRLEPLLDVLVHGQDIALPLGRSRPMPMDAAATAATRVWTMGWPFHARRRLDGFELVAVDHAWSVGRGPQVEGPTAAILLLLTGRYAVLPELSGPGAPDLTARLAPAPA
ncbi:maleylpyruvate isomerase family mycothiol-dependent enzyme [Micromonospora sp. ATA51]|uniref:maleylpyruvate isomerase family mycothiol-dependent enzyme n=1 Tax=Micromonospora sp. ATA51 TaxID=2806098 RepID=UPI001A37070F|nr:maleylpyruvate isomerase family mycothiol-dependent enzyme [Micromonospora sp. ATA51]MBM0227246.1 maleylpyruvate isomerase family mycothiol-dependent enzyme [Micromonospora sp. ATA51]